MVNLEHLLWNIERKNNPMQQAAIYVRTNLHYDEVAERRATEARITQCLRFARKQGYAVAYIYQDIVPGLTKEHEGLNHLRKALPEIAALIVDNFSQLSRDAVMLAQLLAECKEAGVRVRSVAASPPGYQWNEDYTVLVACPEEANLI